MSSNNKIYKSLGFGSIILAIFFALAVFILKQLEFNFPTNPIFQSAITKYLLKEGYTLSFNIIIIGAIGFICAFVFKHMWKTYVQPALSVFSESINSELNDLSKDVKTDIRGFKNDINQIMKHSLSENKEDALTGLIEKSDPETIKKLMYKLHEKAFGTHCGKAEGLYGYLNKDVYPFLSPIVPHRSGYTQTINISETPEKKIIWNEVIDFEIHTVAFDSSYPYPANKEQVISYPFNFITSGKYVDAHQISMSIVIDGEIIANLQELIQFDEKQLKIISLNEDILTVSSNSNGFVEFRFHFNIEIKHSKVKVQTHEKSYLDEEDNFYVVRRGSPSFGSNISISLPHDWIITSFTVPDEKLWGNPSTRLELSSNSVSAKCSNWVMPGIIASCNWKRT